MRNLKLNALKNVELQKREMSKVIGGGCCNCGCAGSSSVSSNARANCKEGYTKTKGGTLVSIKDNGDGTYSECM